MKPDKNHPAWLHKAMADGGWVGEADSGKDKKVEVQNLRDAATTKMRAAAALVPGGITGAILGRKSIKAVPAALTAIGTGIVAAKDAGDDRNRASKLNEEADKAEGRKRGGKVKGKK